MAGNVLIVHLNDEAQVKAALFALNQSAVALRRRRLQAGLSVDQRLDLVFSREKLAELVQEGGFSASRLRELWNRISGKMYVSGRYPCHRRFILGMNGGLYLGMLLSEHCCIRGIHGNDQRLLSWILAEFGLTGVDGRAWEEKFMKKHGLEYS